LDNKKINKKDEEIIYKDNYVELKKALYETNSGYTGKWAYLERKNRQKAAVIIPIINNDNILLIKQYRIPIDSYIIEFPAGLIEDGEEIGSAALRELEEETGYKGEIVEISSSLPTSPGLTSEEIYFIIVKITGSGNKNLEEVEDIENLIIPTKDLKNRLKELSKTGIKIDSKVWALATGIFFE